MIKGARVLVSSLLAFLLCLSARAGGPPTSDVLVQRVGDLRHDDLPEMLKLGIIRVLVSPTRTDFFVDRGQPMGFSHDLLTAYRDYLNKSLGKNGRKLTIIFVPVAFDDLIPSLLDGKGDVIASNLTVTPERATKVAFSDPYITDVSEVVVSGPSSPEIDSLDGLSGRELLLVEGSSYAVHARQLSDELVRRGRKPIRIHTPERPLENDDILELVAAGSVSFTACDRHVAELWAKVLPNLNVHSDLALASGNNIAFAVRPESRELLASLNRFVADHKKGTLLGNMLFKRYFVDPRWCRESLQPPTNDRLGQLASDFKQYAAKYEFDWLLMAAQGFQESRLDQNKRSGVGAIGVMQVLPSTARQMECGDISVASNNIHAGIKYMAWLRENYFSDPDLKPGPRVDFTLAAYNAGPGRIRQLREKARAEGLNPDIWFDNVEQIAMQEIGIETVRYVRNINKYYVAYSSILALQEERGK
ncbi:MAG: transporter substrate-binding domain-containing protein [Phycisphaerales bacterium]|nr:transporter substrate-binding domain-containing protein [Planctomycetota bacterium]